MFSLWIRNLAYWLLMALITPPLFVVLVLAAPFPRGIHTLATRWALMLMWLLENIVGLKYRVEGAENIPAGPAIICCKHQSGWETLAMQKIFPPQVFVAKRELFLIPFFGWGLKLAGTIGIDRRNPGQAAAQIIEQGSKRKAQGFWITIFPEGTRVKPGSKGRYKSGAARTATLLEMDIVPVALNSGEFWPKNSFLKHPGEISVVICPPIKHDSGSINELTAACEAAIESQMPRITGRGPCYAGQAKGSPQQNNAA
ncbi:acyl-phosphate glycerol 3-phosphate acyltransferase [Eikenella longinqua]|uniref:Acyl-phosphate glycerol 3-phosphate acyltransferase n=1 Tax=Eikenella longinqua TaxID=1795827 RepID=A0A1A9RXY9_9NEIS|nr:lysophospholipid acyltransferase family protein [Eikenella longinqua]OAM27744.1 acyl-phosphate glycerol 3-phosphate acyltransferase [Eikenella longinqua]